MSRVRHVSLMYDRGSLGYQGKNSLSYPPLIVAPRARQAEDLSHSMNDRRTKVKPKNLRQVAEGPHGHETSLGN